jgi:hypothetical protein
MFGKTVGSGLFARVRFFHRPNRAARGHLMKSKLEWLKDVSIRVGSIIAPIVSLLAVVWGASKLLSWVTALLYPHGAPKWFFYVGIGLLTLVWLFLALLFSARTTTLSYKAGYRFELPRGRLEHASTPSPKDEAVLTEQLAEFLPAKYVNIAVTEDLGRDVRRLELFEGIYTNVEYILGVQIGVSPDLRFVGQQQRGLDHPSQEPIILDVVVALADNLEITGQSWGTITWAPNGNSTSANFRLKAISVAGGGARLKIIIYYEFDLIFCSDLRFDVMSEGDDWPIDKLGVRWSEVPTERARGLSIFRRFEDLERSDKRKLNISIHRRSHNVYDLLFCLRDEDHRSVYPVSIAVSEEELSAFLARSRAALRRLVDDDKFAVDPPMETFLSDKPITGKSDALKAAPVQALLENMTVIGRDLWNVLFGSEQGRRLFQKIEQIIGSEKEAVVQVWTDANSSDFTFPWVWLHSREVLSGRKIYPDHTAFWGYRYVIEQIRSLPNTPRPTNHLQGAPIKLAAGFHTFPFSVYQRNKFKFWTDTCAMRFTWKEVPHAEWATFLPACDSHILYLYCHGHTELPLDPKDAELIRTLKRVSKSHDIDVLKALTVEEQRKIRGSSYIQIGHTKLTISDLNQFQHWKEKCNPLVFLNMCESAEMYPGLTSNFVDTFLQKGACGVIGTEVPMIASFGNYFANRFFDLMFLTDSSAVDSQSRSIGEILLQMRREFMDTGNPLAFAYTYFGDANERLKPAVFQKQDLETPIIQSYTGGNDDER